jgi:hypothetical protein
LKTINTENDNFYSIFSLDNMWMLEILVFYYIIYENIILFHFIINNEYL